MAMARDANELGDLGYKKMVQLACILGRFCYGLTFILEEAELAAVP